MPWMARHRHGPHGSGEVCGRGIQGGFGEGPGFCQEEGKGWSLSGDGVPETGFLSMPWTVREPGAAGVFGKAGDMLAIHEDAADEKERIVDMICRGDVEELLELQECSNYGLTGGIAGLGYGCLCDSEKTFNLLRIK